MSTKKQEFTFKNFLKYLKKCWIFIFIFMIIGLVGGLFFVNRSPVTYSATTKFIIHNAEVDQGSAASPYAQFKEIISSKKIIKDKLQLDISADNLEVKELTRGIFVITYTDKDADAAVNNVKTLGENIDTIISEAYSDAEKYEVTTLAIDETATPSTTTKNNILMIILATIAMGVLATIMLFIKFDFTTEK